ncbi:MAG: ATP-binding protein [Patescibacteria group bacterium]
MKKDEIYAILNDWNLWNHRLKTGVERPVYLRKLQSILPSGQVVVITGPRRSGKSFVMRQLAQNLVDSGVPANQILSVNFEDPRLSPLDAGLLQEIFETYIEYMRPAGKPYIFLDEIQEVDQWEKWVRTMHELNKAVIVISGSNAKLLSTELSTVLTGRHLDTRVLPLSFSEFLLFNDLNLREQNDIVLNQTRVNGLWRDYLNNGGFPETVMSDNKKEILLHYFEDLAEKDLARRYHLRKADKIKELARFYLSNTARPTTFSSVGKFLDITAATAERFSHYLENAFLCFFLRRFSFTVKEQTKSPRKVYSVDTGLSRAVGFESSPNIGWHAENAVFLELLRRQADNLDLELFYWKDVQHHEVDFVLKEKERVIQLIQVVWDMSNPKVREREKKNLLKAMAELKCQNGLVLTLDFVGEEDVDGVKVVYRTIVDWLLFGE